MFDTIDPLYLAVGATAAVGLFSIIFLWKGSSPKLLPLDGFRPIPLIRKQNLSHDTVKFTFGLPTPTHILGLPTGQHISLKYTADKIVQRSYTPVTDNSTLGELSIVVKVYKPCEKFPEGGKMSQHLDSLKIGDTVLMKGPKGHLEYFGNGKFKVKPLGKPLENRATKQIGMMAGGTGITPMLQVLHAIFRNPNDTTCVKLIYANQSESDILVREELEALQKEFPNRMSLWYTVDRADKHWKYSTGFLNKRMMEEHLFFGDGETQFFMCGPPPMIKFACLPALKELGYSEKDWVVF